MQEITQDSSSIPGAEKGNHTEKDKVAAKKRGLQRQPNYESKDVSRE